MSSFHSALALAFLVPASARDRLMRSALSSSWSLLLVLLPAAALVCLRLVPFSGTRLGRVHLPARQLLLLLVRLRTLGSATLRGWHPSSTTRYAEWLLSPRLPLTIGNGFFVNLMLISWRPLRRQREPQTSERGRPFTCVGSALRCRSSLLPPTLSELWQLR